MTEGWTRWIPTSEEGERYSQKLPIMFSQIECTTISRFEVSDDLPYPYWSCSAKLIVLSWNITDEEMVSAIGMEPDRRWTKGVLRNPKYPAGINRTSGVEYSSGEPTNVPAYNHAEAVLAKVRPIADKIVELARTATPPSDLNDVPDSWIYLFLCMFAGPYHENIRVRSHQIQELARMGAAFELAISFDTGESPPDS
jgi:Domain of unknown function (DUF4279)